MTKRTRIAVVVCAWITVAGAVVSRLQAVACSPDCGPQEVCNETTGQCFELDLNCPAGGPIAQFDPSALGIATNELADGRYDAASRAELLSYIGVKRGQIAISWGQIQPSPHAPYDWAKADSRIEALVSEGLDPVVLLGDPAPWAGRGHRILDLPAWSDFVRAAVSRYGGGSSGNGTVRNWQFENEPNLPISPYYGDPAGYAALLKRMMTEAHAVDATARVWGPSVVWLAGNDGYGTNGTGGPGCVACPDCTEWPRSLACSEPMDYLQRVLNGAQPDVVSIHIYEPDPERMLDVYLAVVDRLANRPTPLRAIPIVVNEGHFGFRPDRTSENETYPGCPYDIGQDLLAQDVASFYSCMLSTNASEVLWFNGSDRFTPGSPCGPGTINIRGTGVLGFAVDPNLPVDPPPPYPFEPASIKNAYYALRAVARAQEARADADARLAAVPSTCRIAPGASSCATTLVWTGRYSPPNSPPNFLQVWRDALPNPVSVGCTAPGALGQAVVQLDSAWAKFELREVTDDTCPDSPTGLIVDHVSVRGDASLSDRARGAVFALDSPCSIVPAQGNDPAGCSLALAWWSDGVDTVQYPKVKVFAGGMKYLCVDAETTGIVRTQVWSTAGGILFRLYEAEGCESTAGLGRLLAATRARGE
ncbi:MAG: hypothetical protein KBI44_08535 [Thermoanaerobaculia bacterium]|nr:hypothetical protein [Thermoanaerobaculia bacterium]